VALDSFRRSPRGPFSFVLISFPPPNGFAVPLLPKRCFPDWFFSFLELISTIGLGALSAYLLPFFFSPFFACSGHDVVPSEICDKRGRAGDPTLPTSAGLPTAGILFYRSGSHGFPPRAICSLFNLCPPFSWNCGRIPPPKKRSFFSGQFIALSPENPFFFLGPLRPIPV